MGVCARTAGAGEESTSRVYEVVWQNINHCGGGGTGQGKAGMQAGIHAGTLPHRDIPHAFPQQLCPHRSVRAVSGLPSSGAGKEERTGGLRQAQTRAITR
jgi:hypothetical protein